MLHKILSTITGMFSPEKEEVILLDEHVGDSGCISGSYMDLLNSKYSVQEKKDTHLQVCNDIDTLLDHASAAMNNRLKIYDPSEDDIKNLDNFVQGIYNPILFLNDKSEILTINKQFIRMVDCENIMNIIGRDMNDFVESDILKENQLYFSKVMNATESSIHGNLIYTPTQHMVSISSGGKKIRASLRFSSYKFDEYPIVVMLEFTVLHTEEIGRQKYGKEFFSIS